MTEAYRPTIYDVAERAGVSIATVSHVINRPEKVSEKTRRRVMSAVDELQFVPKAAAVSHARRGVGRIGVIAPFSSYPTYGMRLLGALSDLESDALEAVMFDHASVASSPSPLLASLPTTGRLDGLVVMGVPVDDAMARRLTDRRLPTVLVDSVHPRLSSVNVDDEAGGYAIGRHLIATGRRSVVFLSEGQASDEYVSPGMLRLRGIDRAFAEAGVEPGRVEMVVTTNDLAGGRSAATEIAERRSRPDAVVCHHDDLAAGLLLGLRDTGVEVPDQIAVVGYDGGLLADALELTTVRQPFHETGRVAASLLRGQLADRSQPVQHITLVPELVVGRTT